MMQPKPGKFINIRDWIPATEIYIEVEIENQLIRKMKLKFRLQYEIEVKG